MIPVLNLTQHKATIDQINAGVFDLDDATFAKLQPLLTFDEIPTHNEMMLRAYAIRDIVRDKEQSNLVMLGGAPFFMGILEKVLANSGYTMLYSFSKRISEEFTNDSGEVLKRNVFKHIGFVHST